MSARKDAIKKAIADATASRRDIDSLNQEYALAHNAFVKLMTTTPTKGRVSGTDVETLRLQCLATYESLLDHIRIHHDNLAHLAVLKGKI